MEKETKPFTQEQIDKIVKRAEHVAFHPVDENDIEVDPITVEEQGTSLSENDEGGVWVRAWVYVRLADVFGGEDETEPPECGHSACRQNWIDTASTDCVNPEEV